MSFIIVPPSPGVTVPAATRVPFANSTATDFSSSALFFYDTVVDTAGNENLNVQSITRNSSSLPLTLWGAGGVAIGGRDVSSGSTLPELFISGNNNTTAGGSAVRILSGSGAGTGRGGNVTLRCGDSGASATLGGSMTIGAGGASAGTGGSVTIHAGAGLTGTTAIIFRGFSSGGTLMQLYYDQGGGGIPKIGFYTATPVARATVAGAAAVFVAGAGVAVQDVSTFDGYTLAQVVKALRNIGVLT